MAGRKRRDELAQAGPAPAPAPGTVLANQRSPLPLYHRIYVLLREQIVTGAYRVGASLPTEAELIVRFGVSRITARRALDELASEGLVTRTRGRGTLVAERTPGALAATPIVAGIEGLMANLSLIGQQTSVTLHEFGFVPASDAVAAELGIEPGTSVQRAVRTRSLDGAPYSLSTTFVSKPVARTFTRRELAVVPLIELVTRSGRRIDHVEQRLTATLADDIAAQRLAVHVASPLLRVNRKFVEAGGMCCYCADILYPSSRFEYRMTLTRGENDRFRLAPGP